MGNAVGILAIFIIQTQHAQARHVLHHLRKLGKKWPGKIDALTVLQGVPIVAPPAFLAIDFIRFIPAWAGSRRVSGGGINGYHLFSAQIATAVIQSTLIAERTTALAAAIGTKRGGENGISNILVDRRDAFQKKQVVLLDLQWN